MANHARAGAEAGPDPLAASDPDDGRDAGGEGKAQALARAQIGKKRAELLGKHMIPVVLGPDERYYVVDHHHLARALHDEGVKDVLVTVIADLTMVDRDAFWGVMDNKRWVYPYDARGERRHFRDIPKSGRPTSRTIRSAASPANCAGPAALPRTPPRSANSCGRISCAAICRARASRTILTRALEKGLALVKGKDAVYLPGWCGPASDD